MQQYNMVRKIPERFKKVVAAFDAEAWLRLCQSSGSEHSPAADSFPDLSDLVTSFVEREGESRVEEGGDEGTEARNESDLDDGSEGGSFGWFDYETTKSRLEEIFGYNRGEKKSDCHGDEEKAKILAEVEVACKLIGHESSRDFKRGLMAYLRKRGFDAGLCKSRWEKTGGVPSGDYQYVDVNMNGVRYIVELSLAGEFKIARPTVQFDSLIELFPTIFVGRPDELNQVVRLLSGAIKQSLRSRDLLVPPWRRKGYMNAKWLGSYKRTTNRTSAASTSKFTDVEEQPSTGFDAPAAAVVHFCREHFARKTRHNAGLLTEALTGDGS